MTKNQKSEVKISYANPKPARTIAEDFGIAENLMHNGRMKYTTAVEKTTVATMELEILGIPQSEDHFE